MTYYCLVDFGNAKQVNVPIIKRNHYTIWIDTGTKIVKRHIVKHRVHFL